MVVAMSAHTNIDKRQRSTHGASDLGRSRWRRDSWSSLAPPDQLIRLA